MCPPVAPQLCAGREGLLGPQRQQRPQQSLNVGWISGRGTGQGREKPEAQAEGRDEQAWWSEVGACRAGRPCFTQSRRRSLGREGWEWPPSDVWGTGQKGLCLALLPAGRSLPCLHVPPQEEHPHDGPDLLFQVQHHIC